MQTLTEDGQRIVEDVAKRHALSFDAVYHLLLAIVAGTGRQAQFNHEDLGGMGQWSQGGMTMIGDMLNKPLKMRVEAVCNELAGFVHAKSSAQSQAQNGVTSGSLNAPKGGARRANRLFITNTPKVLWPKELGTPSSSGSQNDLHYAVFPQTSRLAIARNDQITIYDTADHVISGLAQQQGDDQSLILTSQHGQVLLSNLTVVSTGIMKRARRARTGSAAAPAPQPQAEAQPQHQAQPSATPPTPGATAVEQSAPETAQKAQPIPTTSGDEIFSRIERLADLRKKDIITAEEFAAKKTELLARL